MRSVQRGRRHAFVSAHGCGNRLLYTDSMGGRDAPAAEASWIAAERRRIEQALDAAIPSEDTFPQTLHRAMRYSLFAGGKRLRPLLCRSAAFAVGGRDVEAALIPACALELIHTYSLIHDDLPALDNDDYRRGHPTCHKVFGEATAILAGDALFTCAFAHIAMLADADVALRLVRELSAAAGTPRGMVAGQMADLEAARETATAESMDAVHRYKTAALIRAAVVMGGMSTGATEPQLQHLSAFGESAGLAFQIVDDILDVTGTTANLGKTAGKDAAQRKVTYAAMFGVERSRERVQRLAAEAARALAPLGEAAGRLHTLSLLMTERAR